MLFRVLHNMQNIQNIQKLEKKYFKIKLITINLIYNLNFILNIFFISIKIS